MLLNRPITAIILILAAFIFGGLALNELSVDLLPDVDSPNLVVRTDWQGASPREIENRVNERLDAVLSTIPGIERVHGFARQGQSIIYLNFRWGHNMDLAFLNVREKLDQVQYSLPEQAERPQLIFNTTADEPIAVLAVTSKNRPNEQFDTRLDLKRWAEQVLSRRLEQAEGIAQVVLVGAVEPEVQIRYLPRELDRFSLSLSQVQSLVQSANLFTSSGELRDGWYRYSLKIESRIEELDDLENVPLSRLGQGRILTLGEVAEIELAEADPRSFATVSGETVLNLLVKKEFGSNTVEVYDTLTPLLDQMREQHPNISIEVLREDATFIRKAIQNLLQTLLIGGILAFFVLFAFLNDIRTPFTIGIAIPVSIFLTFFVMYGSGIQLNIVSLSGLTLGIGLLLDNAIVVLENINRHMPVAPSVKRAAAVGTKEISLAVTASTFTTISVFLPLVFLGGFEGAFFQDQAYTLSISLLASLLVALIILPVLVVQIKKKNESSSSNNQTEGRLNTRKFFDNLLDRYEESLQRVLKKPAFICIIAILLIFSAVYAFLSVPKTVLPEDEPSLVSYRIQLPGNTSLNSTKEAADALRLRLQNAQLGGQKIQMEGGYTDQTNLANLAREGLNKFSINIPVNGYEEAEKVQELISKFDRDFPGWTTEPIADTQSWSTMIGADQPPVLFRMIGLDRTESERMSSELQNYMADVGLLVEFQKQYEQEVDIWNLRFRSDRLLQLGIDEQEVIRYLESVTRGSFVTDWNREDERIAIRLKGRDGEQQIYSPESISLRLGAREIPLSYIAEIEKSTEPEQLERVNQTPVLSYVANWNLADWWWNGGETVESIQQFMRNTGQEVQVAGNALMVQSLMTDMGKLLLLSILIIYIILSIQFENLKYPLIIITAVPFAWIGSVLLLWVSGLSLNALSFMGILILTGIAVNDSILKVDFMRRYLEETGNLLEAVELAGKHRFRPVVMTSITTVLGLVPMLIPFGDGYAFRQSLAIALMGGMVSSTFLTLYLIPLIFKWVETGKVKRQT
ncbi:efflux RND transporter permease subunit [Rhodohalobacter sulfatireducens]|uniref:Efflux RND transporter permease subunit n=1 Tax=Rhodohalobacter sulfatireducens TaxID=2911366 RepID=A0ABS9KBL2_9BACT|nr:efflux RND transporter permease subunit [Rhodohalobacter sulfatireducens]MCG2588238.1 efflux RND transporter permease subunit [Rhodohalobacter sulfatireducens]